jgi:hypothetical protein
MQIRGTKAIVHTNTYISMLDLTRIPPRIILYTALLQFGFFICYPASFFKVVFSTAFFQDPTWIFRCSQHLAPLRVRSADRVILHGSLHGLANVFPHWVFLFGFLQIFLQSILSGCFNVGLSTSAFLQLGMLVLRLCSVPVWLLSGADGRLCRAAQAADAGAAAQRRRPDQRRRPVGGVLDRDSLAKGKIAGVKLTTYGVLLLV